VSGLCTIRKQHWLSLARSYELSERLTWSAVCSKGTVGIRGRSIAFVTEVRARDKMSVGIVGVVKVDVVAKNLTANWMVGDFIMYQRPPK
jgi:hypothetical protein